MIPQDDDLIELLAETLAVVDTPPASLMDAARTAYTWRTVDSELATLVADTTASLPAGTRSSTGARILTFSAGETMIVLEIAKERHVRRVIGQVLDATRATVDVRHGDGSLAVTTDEWGRFRASPLPDGPLSVTCRFDGHERMPISTSWITV